MSLYHKIRKNWLFNYFILLIALVNVDLHIVAIQITWNAILFYAVINMFLALALLTIARTEKNGKNFIRAIGILIVMYAVVQSCYIKVFDVPFRFHQLSIIKELFSVTDTAKSTFSWNMLWFGLSFLLFCLVSPTYKKGNKNTAALLLLAIVCNIVTLDMTNGFNLYNRKVSGVQHMFKYDLELSAEAMIERFQVDEEELDKFNKDNSIVEQNDFTGLFEGKNLIMILCESLDDYAISEELTPTLYYLKNNGWYFENYHSPLYEYHTVDTEFITLTGQLPSLNYGLTNYAFSNKKYESALPLLFAENGYSAKSYHSYIKEYYNRIKMHESFGFQRFYSVEDITNDKTDLITIHSVSDEQLFDFIEYDDEPFYKFVITLSGHCEYDNDFRKDIQGERQVIEQHEEYKTLDSETKNYLAAQMKLDKGLERLLQNLKESDAYDDTVIILYGDHVPYTLVSEEAKSTVIKDDRVPFLIFSPEQAARTVEKDCSIEDVYPTILNLFGIDNNGNYMAGVDALSVNDSRLIDPHTIQNIYPDLYKYSQWNLCER